MYNNYGSGASNLGGMNNLNLVKGPNSTADSSIHKINMTPNSVLSLVPRESYRENEKNILDGNKLKMLIGNLRNPQKEKG